MSKLVLEIGNLNDIHPGISRGIALAYNEAIRVCLDRHHLSPSNFEIVDPEGQHIAEVCWELADEAIRKAWANNDDAMEQAAYGLALALVQATKNLLAVRRAETRTGADYYLAPASLVDDLEIAYRLEVSGTDKGTPSQIRGRFRQKVEQTRKGDNYLPAIVVVVGFAVLKIMSGNVN